MLESIVKLIFANPLLLALIKILIIFAVLSGIVAYLVYMERKVLAFMQARLGPMRVGPWGLLQPVADGLKLTAQRRHHSGGRGRVAFPDGPRPSVFSPPSRFLPPFPSRAIFMSPTSISAFSLSWRFPRLVSTELSLGGWASNSHYPLLGALRSSAQLVSYEVAAGMALVGVLLISNSLSMVDIVNRQFSMGVWNVFLQPLAFLIYVIAAVAETNRNPFDLPEAESELTAGFHTEYSGFRFALYFMAEYTNMVVVSCIAVTLFLGGGCGPLPAIRALDFLKFTPILAFVGAAGFVLWLGLKGSRGAGALLFHGPRRGICGARDSGGLSPGAQCHSGNFLVWRQSAGIPLRLHLVSCNFSALSL